MSSVSGLVNAVLSKIKVVSVAGRIANVPSIQLSPGQQIVGRDNAAIVFSSGVDGIQVTSNNMIRDVRLQVEPERRAIFTDPTIQALGEVSISNVVAVGQVQILARDKVRSGHVNVEGLDVVAADSRNRPDRPNGYGVDVLQGAFTLWNMQSDPSSVLTGRLLNISAGREGAPVLGSGVFLCGGGKGEGGRLQVTDLETGVIFSDGKIPPGTPDMITGGVIVLHGTHVDRVRNRGPVTTYGTNDMVHDLWGDVGEWIVEGAVTSHGPSGIGFVNFGTIKNLLVTAPIETHGLGARGFNEYDGMVDTAEFDRIVTFGPGAIGVQISRPVGRLIVHRGIETHGGAGDSLVKGVVKHLLAYAVSVQPGGSVMEMTVEGGMTTEGDNLTTLQVQDKVARLHVSGGIRAKGHGSDGIQVEGGTIPLVDLEITAENGVAVKLNKATITDFRNTKARGAVGDLVVESDSRVTTGAGSVEELSQGFRNSFKVSGPASLFFAKPS